MRIVVVLVGLAVIGCASPYKSVAKECGGLSGAAYVACAQRVHAWNLRRQAILLGIAAEETPAFPSFMPDQSIYHLGTTPPATPGPLPVPVGPPSWSAPEPVPPVRIIPYGEVKEFMPGIGPGGAAK